MKLACGQWGGRFRSASKTAACDGCETWPTLNPTRTADVQLAELALINIERVAMHHRLEVTLLKRGRTVNIPEISALASRLLAVVEVRAKLSRHLSERIDSLIAGDAHQPCAGLSRQ
jgi:hypothetical protein